MAVMRRRTGSPAFFKAKKAKRPATCRSMGCVRPPSEAGCWRCKTRQWCDECLDDAALYVDYVDRSFAGLFRVKLCGPCARHPHAANLPVVDARAILRGLADFRR